MKQKQTIRPATGKLGVLMPGMGAVATTFIAGVEAVRAGLAKPIGSLTQMGTIRLGKRTDNRSPLIKDFVPLAELDDLVFGGWDIFADNAYEAAVQRRRAREGPARPAAATQLEAITPMPAVFDKNYVKKLDGHPRQEGHELDGAGRAAACEDIESFKTENGCDRLVMVWCGSTEIFLEAKPVHQTLEAFEKGLRKNDPDIAPSMIYAYAAIKEGVPYANGAPNLSADIPGPRSSWPSEMRVPICGKDFKTGQTLMKTILAPGFKARLLGLNGWFSTNILGNRDGEVLDDPESFKTKEESASSACSTRSCSRELYPDLYGNIYHKVRINYYPPRGDNKEGWDNIDIFGWLGYPMQIKVDFLCRDSHPRRAHRARPGAVPRPGASAPACAASRSGCRSTSRARRPRPASTPSTTCSSS